MSEEEKSEVEKLLDKTETISRTQYRKETKGGGRTTEYEKFADLADKELEKDGEAKKVPEITENQVSSIRTQVDKLNHDDAEKKDEKEFVVTRRKITEGGEDVTDEDGNQLYHAWIARQEPVDPFGDRERKSGENAEDSE